MLSILRRKLAAAAATAWFAYVTIFLLQLKLIWDCWKLRDLTSGDTSSYFQMASEWLKTWHVPIAWSPLYTTFYGSLMYFSDDAYVVTTAHRMIIVLVSRHSGSRPDAAPVTARHRMDGRGMVGSPADRFQLPV